MKRLWTSRNFLAAVAVCLLFAGVSWLSLSSIRRLQGNARVINYVGIVRGATQRLVKKELQGHPDEALAKRLDGIVDELIGGGGRNGLVGLRGDVYLANMRQVRESWAGVRREIARVRAGTDDGTLYRLSEGYFTLVDDTVSSAEVFTERQVERSITILWYVNGLFALMLAAGLVSHLRTLALRRRADMLGKIAFVDPLTGLPNRAGCEREMEELAKNPPAGETLVFVFDMNNLKKINDELGHTAGDQVIAAFGGVLGRAAAGAGFAGRFGGDEFVGFFRDADGETASRYAEAVDRGIQAYNAGERDELRRISCAAGHCAGDLRTTTVGELMAEADRRMYERKRRMKESVLDGIMERVAGAARELAEVAQSVHDSSLELSAGSVQQQAVFERFSEAARTLRGHAEDFSRSARRTSEMVASIQRCARDGNADMDRLERNMADIAENSRQLDDALKSIDEIAFQTNILSLNASIEAARAGRNGQGFNVVADEVRQLANRSARSVETSSEVISRSSEGIRLGVELSKTTATHLQGIGATSRTAGDLMNEISVKAKDQEGVVSEIVSDLSEVAVIARKTSETAAANAGAAERLLRMATSMRRMLDFGQSVERLSPGAILPGDAAKTALGV